MLSHLPKALIKHISRTEVLPRRCTKLVHLFCTEFVSGETFYRSSTNLGTKPTSSEVAYSNPSTRTLTTTHLQTYIVANATSG